MQVGQRREHWACELGMSTLGRSWGLGGGKGRGRRTLQEQYCIQYLKERAIQGENGWDWRRERNVCPRGRQWQRGRETVDSGVWKCAPGEVLDIVSLKLNHEQLCDCLTGITLKNECLGLER